MVSLNIKTVKKTEFVDITKINELIDFPKGAVLIFTGHTTAGLVLNENEPGLVFDAEKFIENFVPEGNYRHNHIDNNARSHLQSLFFTQSLVLPVKNGRLDLGTWQSVFFVELDGPRTRNVSVSNLI